MAMTLNDIEDKKLAANLIEQEYKNQRELLLIQARYEAQQHLIAKKKSEDAAIRSKNPITSELKELLDVMIDLVCFELDRPYHHKEEVDLLDDDRIFLNNLIADGVYSDTDKGRLNSLRQEYHDELYDYYEDKANK